MKALRRARLVAVYLLAAASVLSAPGPGYGQDADARDAPVAELLDRGWTHFREHRPDAYVEAFELFQAARDEAPDDPRVHAALAAVYWRAYEENWYNRLQVGFSEARRRARDHVEKALTVPTARAYEIDCRIKSFRAKHKAALAACRNAVDLAPDDPEVRHAMALALINAGDPEAALDHVAAARAAAPEMEAYHGLYEGTAEFFAGRSESALEALRRAMAARPDLWSFDTLETGVLCSPCIMIVAALGDLGRTEKAQERVEQFMSYHIDWSVQNELYFRPLKREQDVEHLRESLRAAGVPSQ